MTVEITVIPGDGIGHEVIPAAVRVLESLDLDVETHEAVAGDAVLEDTGTPLPDETIGLARETDATLFGATGHTSADVIIPLRRELQTYANVRPAVAYPGVDALHPETDLVFVRENTEGVYSGIEHDLTDDVSVLTRVITETASRRIAEFAFGHAVDRGADAVTIAHKANVMRLTDGKFLETAQAVGEHYPEVETRTAIMDALAMYLVLDPTEYEVIVSPNLAGDVLSDLAAGLVGGLGLLPSANLGEERGIFEPVHGSAPDIAGQGIANPAAAVLSLAMLLDHVGFPAEANRVDAAVQAVLASGPRTPDLGGDATTESVTDAIIDELAQ